MNGTDGADSGRVYRKKPEVLAREIADELVLVPVASTGNGLQNAALYSLNQTAAFMWAKLDGEASLETVKRQTVEEFDVGGAEAEADLLDFVRHMEGLGLLQAVATEKG
jgi:hypothetical protein